MSEADVVGDGLENKEKEPKQRVVAVLSPDRDTGDKFVEILAKKGMEAWSYHLNEMHGLEIVDPAMVVAEKVQEILDEMEEEP